MSVIPKPAWPKERDPYQSKRFRVIVEKIYDWWNLHDAGQLPWSTLAYGLVVKTTTANYTVVQTDNLVLVDSTGGVVTITLPTAVGIKGRQFSIKDWKGQSATNNITIATSGGQTIDGGATKVLNTAYVSYNVASDGANWAII